MKTGKVHSQPTKRLLARTVAPVLMPPEDLRQWLPETEVLRCVIAAVAEVGTPRLPALPWPDTEGIFTHGTLCSLLAYYYATGRSGTEDMLASVRREAALGYLCVPHPPSATAVRRFRRRHRPTLIAVLAQIAETAASEHGAPTATPSPADCQRWAEDRVERAALEDAVAADV
ncbi:MAG TPA: hypothetical protein PKM73_17400 [Verrucomicrobiota bacterium]|nr:hypothetical protein [Verrucomicrobiota bacterium]HNU51732.1 hypothetical protein [Verrucomicrobiota bacterium]